MKLKYAPVIMSLALLAGCAKNSDVEKLQSQIRRLQSEQIDTTLALQSKLTLTEERLAKAEADLEQAKVFASDLRDTVNSNRETEAADAKDESALERRLIGYESDMETIRAGLDTKADGLEFLNLQRKVAVIAASGEDARDNNSAVEIMRLQHRVDDIVAALRMPDRQRRQWMIDVLH